jgi:hypothetical protein
MDKLLMKSGGLVTEGLIGLGWPENSVAMAAETSSSAAAKIAVVRVAAAALTGLRLPARLARSEAADPSFRCCNHERRVNPQY